MIGKIFTLVFAMSILTFSAYFLFFKGKKNDTIKTVKAKSNHKNYIYVLYAIYNNLPIINKYFNTLRLKVSSVYPSDSLSINKKTTNMMSISLGLSGLTIFITLIASSGDIFYICCGVLLMIIIFRYNITTQLNKIDLMLLEQFSGFLADLRNEYGRTPILEDAIYEAMEKAEYEIGLHIGIIYDIVTNHDEESKKEQIELYIEEAPNNYLTDLLMLCETIEYGDKEIDGISTFLNNLNNVQERLNNTLLEKQDIQNKFKLLTGCCLVPLLVIKPIEAWSIEKFKTADFYHGVSGAVCIILLFIISYVCYIIVETLKNMSRGKIVENSIFQKISNLPILSPILNREINNHYSKADKLNDEMKKTGDMTGPKAFLTKCLCFGLMTFLAVNVFFIANIIQQKIALIKEFSEDFDETLVPNQKYIEIMEEATKRVSKKYVKHGSTNIDSVTQSVLTETDIKNPTYANLVASEIVERAAKYERTYYRWYYLLTSILISAAGACLPYLYLIFKIKVIDMEQENEVNQFISIVIMLMHLDGITIDLVLEWMERFSYCFKNSISECLLELNADEWQSLENMKDKESCPAFKRFCSSLQNVENVGLEKSFTSAVKDRKYNMEKQSRKTTTKITSRAGISSLVAFVPSISVVVVYMIIPIIIIANSMMDIVRNL